MEVFRPSLSLDIFTDRTLLQERLDRVRQTVSDMTIGVLMGGGSREREVSLRSGRGVATALGRATSARVVEIDVNYEELAKSPPWDIDLAYVALHGGRGESGTIQGYLNAVRIPYTGPGVLGCALTMNKIQVKRILQVIGVASPPFVHINQNGAVEAEADRIRSQLGLPAVLKPIAEGSSFGVCIVHDSDELRGGIQRILDEFGGGFAEAFIPEPELTVGVVHGRALPVLQLAPRKEFYDYESKYTKGMTDFLIPAQIPQEVNLAARQAALSTCAAVHTLDLARVDMRVSSEGVLHVTEVNTSPGMTETSDIPAQAAAAGLSYDDLVLEIVGAALIRADRMDPTGWT